MSDQTNARSSDQSNNGSSNQSDNQSVVDNPVPKTNRPESNAYQYVVLAVLSPVLIPIVGMIGLIGYPINQLFFGGDKYDARGFIEPTIDQSLMQPSNQNVECKYRKSVTGLWLFQRIYYPEGVFPNQSNDQSSNQSTRGIVFLIHGFGEHFGRTGYQSLIQQLTSQRFIVCMLDQIGHGRSTGDRAYVSNFEHLVDDQVQFIQSINQSLNPLFSNDLPRFIYGHSMGGLQAVHVAIKLTAINRSVNQPNDESAQQPINHNNHPINIAGLLISSPAAKGDPKVATPINVLAAKIFSFLFPKFGIASVDQSLISRSEQAIKDYGADPLIYQGKMKARYAAEAMKGQNALLPSNNQSSIISTVQLPTLLLHGTDDQVCAIAGSELIYDHLSSKDKQLMRFEGAKHEIIEDPIEAQNYKNAIVNFMLKRC